MPRGSSSRLTMDGSELVGDTPACCPLGVDNSAVHVHTLPGSPPEGLRSGGLTLSYWLDKAHRAGAFPALSPSIPPSPAGIPEVALSSSTCVRILVSGSAWETPTPRWDKGT